MTSRVFYIFLSLFFLIINFSVSDIKINFFQRALFFIFFLVLFLFFRTINLNRILPILTGSISTLIFIYGVVQKYILFPIYLNQLNSGTTEFSKAILVRIKSGRIFSVFQLPTLYTFICSILLLIIFHYLLKSFSTRAKIFWGILFILGFYNLILTQSFAGVVYLLIGFPVYLKLSGYLSFKYLAPGIMVILMFLFIITGLRFSEAKKFDPAKLRISNWSQAARIIETTPFFGIGLGNYETKVPGYIYPGEAHSIYSHNFILQFVAEGGIFLSLFLLSLLLIFRKKIRPAWSEENKLYISILIIVIIYNMIDIGIYFFAPALIFVITLSQLYPKEHQNLKIVIPFIILLSLLHLSLFFSSNYQKEANINLSYKNIKGSEEKFLKSLKFNPFNYKSLLGLSTIKYLKGENEEADKFLKRTINLNHSIPFAHFMRSKILYSQRKLFSSLFHSFKAYSLNRENYEYKKWYLFLEKNLRANTIEKMSSPGAGR
ncbi:MAG: O-antigen ligase family protein [Acidobacteriota bacterium]